MKKMKKVKKKKINKEDYELSVDFNSEIEAEQERQSKTMTREEILSRTEEKKKKDKEEKRKKEGGDDLANWTIEELNSVINEFTQE